MLLFLKKKNNFLNQNLQLIQFHHEQYQQTSERISKEIENIDKNTVIIFVDYSQKLTNYSPNQVSTEFHNPEQFSNEGFVVIVKDEQERIQIKKFAIMSSNFKQTSLLALAGVAKLFSDPDFKQMVEEREKLSIFSDGACTFNNHRWLGLFFDLVNKGIFLPNNNDSFISAMDEMKIFKKIQVNLLIPGHSKTFCDAFFAYLKSLHIAIRKMGISSADLTGFIANLERRHNQVQEKKENENKRKKKN